MSKSRIRAAATARRVTPRPVVMEKDPTHNTPENVAKAVVELKKAIGDQWVSDSPAVCCGYSHDQARNPSVFPHIVCMPKGVDDVKAIYKIANEFLIDVMPVGTGLSCAGLTIVAWGGIVMIMTRDDTIYEIDGDNMFATIGPGVTYLQLQAASQPEGLRTLNPSTSATAAVLSNHLFCNINTMAGKYGFGQDNIMNVEAILPNSELVNTGSRAIDSITGHCQGPGPDVSAMWRFHFGTLGCLTKMTVRLYPEAPFHQQLFPAYEVDDLSILALALHDVARDNLSLELAHLMNSFYGIFIGSDNKEAAKVVEMMPRHNLLTDFGGETQEEADLKCEVTKTMLDEKHGIFDYLPPESIKIMTEDLEHVNVDKWLKYFNVTVRVQRVRGSFLIGALIDKLTNMVGIEKIMREVCTNAVGTNDAALPPDDASTYLQPYHMGRSAYMEYDVYACRADVDDLLHVEIAYWSATMAAMHKGMIIAAGGLTLMKGMMPGFNMAIAAGMPNLVPEMEAFVAMKKTIDPNNISARRWEYETETMKKIFLA